MRYFDYSTSDYLSKPKWSIGLLQYDFGILNGRERGDLFLSHSQTLPHNLSHHEGGINMSSELEFYLHEQAKRASGVKKITLAKDT